ncbi:hypothetical protein AS026_37835 [Rhizobium altiplani]|uniref:3-hydroxyacyl-CoA dehydrogenase NAD binding domain-containing protein n=1 Tax=Rhizobium altiplani TaxID=1864509 RepID=A0A109JUE8_9HYPH|nr:MULTISPECIES: 3-hydroxyacyl-CoA dehydrogenase NAD-binding domain-containing protein [Rhizobium]KWV55140.1 hypothetical protein AS026_37835 [Rhizobium altiplani]
MPTQSRFSSNDPASLLPQTWSGLRDADLIIDAVDDRKALVTIRQLASKAKPGAIIATTGGRDLDGLSDAAARPGAIIGLKPRLSGSRSLIEVVPTARTAPETVSEVLGPLRRLVSGDVWYVTLLNLGHE